MTTKQNLRPEINLPDTGLSSASEKFQNTVLRPILKLQNDMYLTFFGSYLIKQKTQFDAMTKDAKNNFIEKSLQNDSALKNMMLGFTIGLFTTEELKVYLADSKEMNRRVMTMLVKRLKNQLL